MTDGKLKRVNAPTPPGMVIDGRFDEWDALPTVAVDGDDAGSMVDFREIKTFSDERHVYLMFSITKFVNAQGLDGAGYIFLDVDGDTATGTRTGGMDGVDAIIQLTPPNLAQTNKPGMGVGLRSTAFHPPTTMRDDHRLEALNPYDIGLLFAPTHQSPLFEFRIDRGARLPDCPQFFMGTQFSFKLSFLNMTGATGDEAGPFTVTLAPLADSASTADAPAVQTADPLARAESTAIRALDWNIERGAMFTSPEPYVRTLKAIDPDVMILQELTDKNSGDQIQQFLDKQMPLGDDRHWHVSFGSAGGDLRCAVASRYPLEAIPAIASISVQNQQGKPDKTARTDSVRMIVGDRRVLVTSLHLKCCGRGGGPEDQTRINEIRAIHSAIRSVLPGGANGKGENFAGMIIAGDFNLVGSRTPLEMLAILIDLDQTSLSIAEPYQLDGRTNITWADRDQPFTPGRLDFMLYSDSTMKALRSFVYESTDVSAIWAQAKGIQSDDTLNASDHLPIVTDFAWAQ